MELKPLRFFDGLVTVKEGEIFSLGLKGIKYFKTLERFELYFFIGLKIITDFWGTEPYLKYDALLIGFCGFFRE